MKKRCKWIPVRDFVVDTLKMEYKEEMEEKYGKDGLLEFGEKLGNVMYDEKETRPIQSLILLERRIQEYPQFSMKGLAVRKFRGTVETTCSICLTKINHLAMIVKTECDHLFHAKCLFCWLNEKPTCPCCRLNVTFQGIIQHGWL